MRGGRLGWRGGGECEEGRRGWEERSVTREGEDGRGGV